MIHPATTYDGFDKQLIGGTWRHGGSTRRLTDSNPFNGEMLVEIPQANRKDVDTAYYAALTAQRSWAATAPGRKSEILRQAAAVFEDRKEEIISWLIRESGSTRIKATIEWQASRAILLEAAGIPSRVSGLILPSDIPDKESRVYRQPLGVVGVISPWNFPLHLTARSVAPALAAGNAVVVKPASDTPVTGGLLLARILEEAGLPSGVLSVVVGAGSEIGDAFVEHAIPRMISFTGSTEVGKRIAALAASGPHLKRVVLELGGNSPFVVLDDADLDQAVSAAILGKFLHQGQICMAINRIIVDTTLHDAFVDRFVEAARQVACGDPDLPATLVGPIINAQQHNGLHAKIAQAQADGARLLLSGDSRGLVMPPHVFADVTADMAIAREETFGPIAAILRAKDETHALELANASDYGLSAAVFTGDIERGNRFAQRVDAGMTHVNDIPVQDQANSPFGGEKNSGLGRYGGDWVVEEFTRTHWISLQHHPRRF